MRDRPLKVRGVSRDPWNLCEENENALYMKTIKMKIVMKKRGKKVPLSKKDEF